MMHEVTTQVTDEPPRPGVYPDIPIETYLDWPHQNQSPLGMMERSASHYRDALDHPRPPTEAMLKGTLIHLAALEPLKIAERFVVMPDLTSGIVKKDGTPYANVRATKQYGDRVEEFRRVNAGKRVVDQQTYNDVSGAANAVLAHKLASEYLAPNGETEESVVWDDPDTLLRCKARLDKRHHTPRRIVDLKTCRDASDFERSIYKFGYHRQAAFYSDGLFFHTGERHQFCLVAVESTAPYGVRAAPVSDAMLQAGRESYQKALRRIAECRERDEWPGYDDPAEWNLPSWAQNNSEAVTLIIGGESVNL